MKSLELNDLPQYSNWVAELLSDASSKRLKNQQEIVREFGLEKWGALLSRWKDNPCGVDVVRSWAIPQESVLPCLIDGELMLMSAHESHDHYIHLIENTLLVNPSSHLVEIGCGYGAVLFDLARGGTIGYESITGLEYTRQGVELAQNLAKWHGLKVTIAQGDFNATGITNATIVPGSDIFTSFALHYVRNSVIALENILKLNPRRVLHFEPVFQHYRERSVLGLLQRRYLEINDYNSDLRQELERLQRAGVIEVIKEEPMIFGGNCLLPASLLVWRPITNGVVNIADE